MIQNQERLYSDYHLLCLSEGVWATFSRYFLDFPSKACYVDVTACDDAWIRRLVDPINDDINAVIGEFCDTIKVKCLLKPSASSSCSLFRFP